jgi:hypothetical protein
MKSYFNFAPFHVVLLGKATEVFAELAMLAKWEKYGIGCRCYSFSVFSLN